MLYQAFHTGRAVLASAPVLGSAFIAAPLSRQTHAMRRAGIVLAAATLFTQATSRTARERIAFGHLESELVRYICGESSPTTAARTRRVFHRDGRLLICSRPETDARAINSNDARRRHGRSTRLAGSGKTDLRLFFDATGTAFASTHAAPRCPLDPTRRAATSGGSILRHLHANAAGAPPPAHQITASTRQGDAVADDSHRVQC